VVVAGLQALATAQEGPVRDFLKLGLALQGPRQLSRILQSPGSSATSGRIDALVAAVGDGCFLCSNRMYTARSIHNVLLSQH